MWNVSYYIIIITYIILLCKYKVNDNMVSLKTHPIF